MSTSSAITEKKPEPWDEKPPSFLPEWAPSTMRADEPLWPRIAGAVGLMFLTLGCAILVARAMGRITIFGSGWGVFFAVIGICGLLFHAVSDSDLQWRRTYAFAGYVWMALGVLFAVVPFRGEFGALFLPYGLIGYWFGLFFLAAASRHEDDPKWFSIHTQTLVAVGFLTALAGFLLSFWSPNLLLTRGDLFTITGLAYIWMFIGLRGSEDSLGFRAGQALGWMGGIVFLVALIQSALDMRGYFMPYGLTLFAISATYVAISLGVCSDHPLFVMTRRELASYFYSPLGYIIVLGITFLAWWLFRSFVFTELWRSFGPLGSGFPNPQVEPMIARYIIAWFPIICVLFLVPIITMRSLSEEHRTGTLEVLLTAPVGEATVVLSKFFASFLFFNLLWIPWGLFLVALRIEGGQPFDYRPMLAFYVALAFMSCGFLSMGLFFSSLTKNQIAAAIMTFVGMLGWTFIFWGKNEFAEGSVWRTVLTHISYIDLWINAIEGKMALRDLIFHVSAAVFWLFLTVKVLESRKWR
ncbi:MAG: hypothetical protein KatS3mg105_4000 [Gemmatales bacterium]|nr:MAG: hypothetical protein KatS3mg105_4000 [Gemmatales bacterium]